MAHVVTENCHMCRFTDCVVSCPTESFHGDDEMLYIHPEECSDCAACVPACPVEAIYAIEDCPPEMEKWIAINAERAPKLPVVNEQTDPLPTADAKKAKLGF